MCGTTRLQSQGFSWERSNLGRNQGCHHHVSEQQQWLPGTDNLTTRRFVEVHGTIIVSCAPALSSFWFNIFIKSRFYSSLLSATISWTPRSKDRKAASIGYSGERLPDNGSSSQLKKHHTYELYDGVSGRSKCLHTKIYSSAGDSIPTSNVITTSTRIAQSSETV